MIHIKLDQYFCFHTIKEKDAPDCHLDTNLFQLESTNPKKNSQTLDDYNCPNCIYLWIVYLFGWKISRRKLVAKQQLEEVSDLQDERTESTYPGTDADTTTPFYITERGYTPSLRPTSKWTTNQPVGQWSTNQPDKIAAHQPFIPKYKYLRFYYWNWINIENYKTYGSP